MQTTDVIIIGAGIVGLTCACALAQTDLRITIIDARDPCPNFSADHYDTRVSALTYSSQAILHNLDVWKSISAMRVSPYYHMHVWETDDSKAIHFNACDIGKPTLGHIVENSVTQLALLERIKHIDNIQLITNRQLQSCTLNDDVMTLNAQDNHQWQARLVIGADGALSWLRQHCEISQQQRDYQHTAIVATIYSEKPHQLTAWQRFTKEGPLAFLPLADPHYCSIIWSVPPIYAQEFMQLSDHAFSDLLSEQMQQRFGDITLQSVRQSFPLTMRHAKQYVLPRIALIGDAAHTIHPLAGQGMNLGLLDAACLAETVQRAHQRQGDIGRLTTLQRYARWRRGHNTTMLAAMDGFKYLFANQTTWVKQLRNHGLTLSNRIPMLKNTFVRYAMGLHGDQPDLANL